MSGIQLLERPRARLALVGAAVLLAAAAAAVAPSSALLPGPEGFAEQAATTVVLLAAFAYGLVGRHHALFALLPIVVVEGAVRRWLFNDITVFMVKDFLLLGIYAAVVPQLTRAELRRPWWLLAPLGALGLLALVHAPLTGSAEQTVIGLRSYFLYVPLLWVAPKLLASERRAIGFVLMVLALGVIEAALGAVQSLTGDEFLNRLTPGTLPALITDDGTSYIRPPGTFLQVGTFAAFMLFPVLIALALAGCARGRLFWTGVASVAVVSWGVALASSRSLTATVLGAVTGFAVALLVRRRPRPIPVVAVVVAAVAGTLALQNLPLGGAVREGQDSHFKKNIEVQRLDEKGRIVTSTVTIGSGEPKAVGAFIARGAEPTATDVWGGAGHHRFGEQYKVIRQQRLVGHGTGTMTLGSGYAEPDRPLRGEGMYTKAAWELGLPGLVAFVALLAAIAVSAAAGVRAAKGTRRAIALVGLGAAVLVPAWITVTFALDFPIMGILYYVFAGYAVAEHAAARRRGATAA